MKKNNISIPGRNILIICFVLFCFCFNASYSFSQQIENVQESQQVSNIDKAKADQKFKKNLLERTFSVQLSDMEFVERMASNERNIQMWQEVIDKFKNDETVDLSSIEQLVKSMKAKIQ